MIYTLRDANKRALLGGILSNIPGLYSWWDRRRPTGNAYSSVYAKSIWNFHYRNYQRFSHENNPKIVAEFGTGASLGSLIAAIKDNINHVIGLDLVPYADNYTLNKKLVDEIVPIKKYPKLNKEITFNVSNIIENDLSSRINYFAPWDEKDVIPNEYIDFIYSHSVLEHIDNPEHVYNQMFRILKKGGIMSHKIDHSSHKLTKSWNGHYAISNFWWKIFRGNKPYLLNRLTPSEHKQIILKSGFRIIHEEFVRAKIDENSHSNLKNKNQLIKTSLFIVKK